MGIAGMPRHTPFAPPPPPRALGLRGLAVFAGASPLFRPLRSGAGVVCVPRLARLSDGSVAGGAGRNKGTVGGNGGQRRHEVAALPVASLPEVGRGAVESGRYYLTPLMLRTVTVPSTQKSTNERKRPEKPSVPLPSSV